MTTEIKKIYARVVDGVIVEYPVYDIHIKNRAHPVEWYTEVTFDDKPAVPAYHYAREVPKYKNSAVNVSYVVEALTLQNLLSSIYMGPKMMMDPTATVAIGDVAPELVGRIVTLVQEYVQGLLDAFAATRNYDGILSAASYATSTNAQFATEAQRAVNLRDQTWAALYTYLAGIQGGTVTLPKTLDDIKTQLPALTWE